MDDFHFWSTRIETLFVHVLGFDFMVALFCYRSTFWGRIHSVFSSYWFAY